MTNIDLAILTPISSGSYRAKPLIADDEDKFIPESLERFSDRKFTKTDTCGHHFMDRW